MKRKPAAKEARGCEKKPKTGNNSSNGAQSGRNVKKREEKKLADENEKQRIFLFQKQQAEKKEAEAQKRKVLLLEKEHLRLKREITCRKSTGGKAPRKQLATKMARRFKPGIPAGGQKFSRKSSSGKASEKKRKQLKKEARKEGGVVWLVFVEDESGGNGSYGGYGYDNGSHSVELIGVYGTEAAADAAAGAHREEEDVDEHDGCDGEPRCQRRKVDVIKTAIRKTHKSRYKSVYSFEADTDLDAPCNY